MCSKDAALFGQTATVRLSLINSNHIKMHHEKLQIAERELFVYKVDNVTIMFTTFMSCWGRCHRVWHNVYFTTEEWWKLRNSEFTEKLVTGQLSRDWPQAKSGQLNGTS
jgi:hypothetical protein